MRRMELHREKLEGENEMSETQSEGVAAVGFLVMAFTDETAADETLKMMKEAKKQQQFYYEEAAVIKQDAEGKVSYHETGDMTTGKGAGVGALIGGVVGILGGPAGVVLGAGAGAAVGAAIAHGDDAFRDESLDSIGVALKPSTSAIIATTSSAFLKAVREEVSVADTRAIVAELAGEISSRLDEGKSMALGILLAEDGLAIKEVAVSEDSTEVFGYAVTDEAVIAGAAVATDEGVAYEVGVATEEGAVVEAGVITEDEAAIVDVVAIPEESDEAEAEGAEA
jgi:uncharacterized membrane protein